MKINQENLIISGYKGFQSNLRETHKSYLNSYQKRFDDENGKKYFITIDFYDLSNVNEILGVQFEAHSQFNLKNGFTFNVEGLNDKNITIEELESFYDKIWTSMDCEYYE